MIEYSCRRTNNYNLRGREMSSLLRVKCPNCGEVQEIASVQNCKKCNATLDSANNGTVTIYRKGSPVGVAVGYGIYINDQPYGHVANKETVTISLPYGNYNFHFTCGMTRRCNDAKISITPEKPNAYLKASIKMGFWTNTINTEIVTKNDIPNA